MYLRITRARFDPATYEQVSAAAQEVQAAMQQLPGVQHLHQGVERTTGSVAAVSVWDSAEHARFAREVWGEPIGRLRALGVQFEEPEISEIMEDAEAVG